VTDTLLHGGRIFTADPDRPWADSVLIVDGTIAAVGDGPERLAGLDGVDADGVRVVDLEGAFVLPGFVDAHTHLVEMGASRARCRWSTPPISPRSSGGWRPRPPRSSGG